MSTHSQQLGRTTRKKTTPPATAAARRSSLPWAPQMLALYAILTVIGLVVLIVGSSVVSSETTYDDQVPGINLAIVGAVIANAAGVSLLLAGRRAVSMRRVAVLGALPALPVRGAPRPAAKAGTALVGTDGLRHFHREDCALAADRDWPSLSRVQHVEAGRTPCGVCRP